MQAATGGGAASQPRSGKILSHLAGLPAKAFGQHHHDPSIIMIKVEDDDQPETAKGATGDSVHGGY
jgi:hypothetical protein